MARVPIYDGPQVALNPLPAARQEEVDVTANQRLVAKGMQSAANELDQYQQRQDQIAAFDAEAKVKAAWLDYDAQLRPQRQGAAAESYPQEVDAWWKEQAGKLAPELSPNARRLVTKSLTTSQLQAMAGAHGYREHQLNAAAEGAYRAANGASIEEASRVGTPEAVAKALADIKQRSAEYGALKGWNADQVNADRLANSTVLHDSVITQMARRDPAAAQRYYEQANARGEISEAGRDRILPKLEQISAAVDGGNTAREVWAAMGPKADFQPAEMDKMLAAINTKYGNDPTRQRAAHQALAEIAQAQAAAERERLTANVNAVYDQLNAGAPLSRVKTSDAWLKLPGHEQDRITYEREQRLHARIAAESNEAARDLHRLQIEDNLLAIRNWDDYLKLQDPGVLARMSRDEVRATQRTVGRKGAEALVNRWDSMQKPGGLQNAQLDADTFNMFAQRAGLSPNKKGMSEDEKNLLVSARAAVESAIRQEQEQKKRQLNDEERTAVINREFARTVTVHRTFWANKTVPLLATSPDERTRLVLPEPVKARAAKLMQALYGGAKTPADKQRYAPTPENLSRFVAENPELLDGR